MPYLNESLLNRGIETSSTSETIDIKKPITVNSVDVITQTELTTQLENKLDTTLKGAYSGLAELDSSGKVPSDQLPSYVDDVIEYENLAAFPEAGETGKIYTAVDTNYTYRWSGTTYINIGSSLELGETETTAYRGDRGKSAYDHSNLTTGNPHSVSHNDLGTIQGGTTDEYYHLTSEQYSILTNSLQHQLSITSNMTLTDIIPAGYLLELLLIEETSGNDFNLNIGTTNGGTEIIDGIDIIGSNNITGNDTTVLVLNKYFSSTLDQTIYLTSFDWNGVNINCHFQLKYML